MRQYDEYTATVVQPRMRSIAHRREIQSLLQRCLQLIDYATAEGAASSREFAPVKLIAFPEFFLQGYDSRWNLQKILRDIAITLPGEETESLAQKARQYGVYIAGTILELDPYWPDRFFNTAIVIDPNPMKMSQTICKGARSSPRSKGSWKRAFSLNHERYAERTA